MTLRRTGGSRLRRWGVYFAVQGVLAVGILEVGLRIARPHHAGLRALLYSPAVRTHFEAFESTEELLRNTGIGFLPYHTAAGFVLNSRGFRTREYTGPRPAELFRVVVLGDSFAFDSGGVPWSRIWPTRLESLLDVASPRPLEVLSLGFPGEGPRFYLRLWELEGRHLEPDLVVVALFIGNDFTDDDSRPLIATPEARLARRSVTYRLVRNALRLRRELRHDPPWAEPIAPPPAIADGASGRRGGYELEGYAATNEPERPGLAEETFIYIQWGRMQILLRPHRDELERLFEQVAEVLRRLHMDVVRHRAELVVVLIPDEVQVDEELLATLKGRFQVPPEMVDLDLPQRRLGELLAGEKIPYLDLLPIFREAGRHERLYRPRDTHWNERGNELAARELAGFLLQTGLAPAAPAGEG